MIQPIQNYWWKTKAFKIGLGIFVAVAVVAVIFFSEQIGQLLDLFGSRAGTAKLLTIDDNAAQLDGHGFLGAGDTNDSNILYIPATADTPGYVTLE